MGMTPGEYRENCKKTQYIFKVNKKMTKEPKASFGLQTQYELMRSLSFFS